MSSPKIAGKGILTLPAWTLTKRKGTRQRLPFLLAALAPFASGRLQVKAQRKFFSQDSRKFFFAFFLDLLRLTRRFLKARGSGRKGNEASPLLYGLIEKFKLDINQKKERKNEQF